MHIPAISCPRCRSPRTGKEDVRSGLYLIGIHCVRVHPPRCTVRCWNPTCGHSETVEIPAVAVAEVASVAALPLAIGEEARPATSVDPHRAATDREILQVVLAKLGGVGGIGVESFLGAIVRGDGQDLNLDELRALDRVLAEMQAIRRWFDHDELAGLPKETSLAGLLDHWNRRN